MERPRPFLADLGGCLALAGRCAARAGLLRRGPYRERFLHLLLDTARKGLGDGGLRAVALGTLLLAFTLKNLSANAEIAIRILVLFVAREIGPLAAALIVLLRAGSAIAASLGLMGVQGELRALRLLGLPARDYLALPALAAIACATLVLTFYFQLTAVAGGIVVSALLLDLPLREMFEHLTLALTPVDVLYTAVKSFGFGLIIATVGAYYGLEAGRQGPGGLADMLSRSVTHSLFLLLLFNALFAYLVYGLPAAPAGRF